MKSNTAHARLSTREKWLESFEKFSRCETSIQWASCFRALILTLTLEHKSNIFPSLWTFYKSVFLSFSLERREGKKIFFFEKEKEYLNKIMSDFEKLI